MRCLTLANEHLKQAKRQGIKRFVVAGIIVKNKKMLLLQRRKNDFLGGTYELPGGLIQKGETIKKALIREIKEETGLKILAIKDYLDCLDYFSENRKQTRHFNFILKVKPPLKIRLTEHKTYTWIEKNQINKYNITKEMKSSLYKFWRKWKKEECLSN